MPTSLAILFRPRATWVALGTRAPHWSEPLLRHALPLSVLPALAWPFGQVRSGVIPVEALGVAALTTLLLSLATVLLLAAGLYVLSTFFEVPRDWGRAVTVAAYSCTPVLAFGALLFVPILVVASVAPLVHAFLLCDMGVEQVLGCRASDTAGFVAAAAVFTLLASFVLGGLCSAAGLI